MSEKTEPWTYASFANAHESDALRRERRISKFVAQNGVRNILMNDTQDWRTSQCLRNKVTKRHTDVKITHNTKTDSLGSSNLVTCGSVWLCPVCSARLTAEKAERYERILRRSGGVPILITLTLQHNIKESLRTVYTRLNQAYRYMFAGRRRKAFNADFGVIGYLTGRDIRWGHKSGWHPHIHMIVILRERPIDGGRAIKKRLNATYGAYLRSLGLLTNSKTIDISTKNVDPKEGAKYLTKGGGKLSLELANGQEKQGKGSYSAFQLSELVRLHGQQWARSLFIEYAKVTKGKKLCTGSDSLKEFDYDDQEDGEGEVTPFASLIWYVWDNIKNSGLRGAFFALATGGKVMVLYNWLLENGLASVEDIEAMENQQKIERARALENAKKHTELAHLRVEKLNNQGYTQLPLVI